MAEFLIRVKDKINPDFYMDCGCTKRGDVIVVQPDGWNWGKEEKSLPFYRIIRHSGVSVSEASQFLAAELPIDPLNPSRTLKRRAFKMDIDFASLPAGLKNFLKDDTRATPILDITGAGVAKAALLALKVDKGLTPDPAVIGGNEVIIG